MSKENSDKNEHGANGVDSLARMVESLEKIDYIVTSKKKYRIADPEYGEEQFYFQFLIEFHDHEQWILHHTTSIRDRITEQQWNSEHIKRLNENVKKAYVVVPDGLNPKEKANAENYNEKIENRKIYSALDGVISLETAYRLIEHKASGLLDDGKAKAKLGLHFEDKMVAALNNEQNLHKWKDNNSTSVGYLYSLYTDLMNALKIDPKTVDYISATSDIPRLPSGGLPKTDVLMELHQLDGTKNDYTFSCKRSAANRVSVHEYPAETFSKVLNPDDYELKGLLYEFQDVGGIRSMDADKAIALEKRLYPYLRKLSLWAIGGIGGEGNPSVQWASHIISVDENTNSYNIKTIENYIQECLDSNCKGQFGTIFQWTYPSGGLGKRIQLKMKL